MSEPSIFTKILNGDIPGEIIYQDELVFAVRDINPVAPTHILIIPRQEIPNTSGFSEETEHIAGRLLVVAGKIAKQEGITDGYRVVINEGQNGGQHVVHVHLHLLAGRKMTWPPG